MTIKYTFKNDVGNKKLPPQLLTIINLIKATEGGITRDDLVAALTEGNKLNTRQPVERVLSYYHTRMEELDAVTITKPAKQIAAPVAAKAKKETIVISAGDVAKVPADVMNPAGNMPPPNAPASPGAKGKALV
jgi:hypothetical protein